MRRIDWSLVWLMVGFALVSFVYLFQPGSEDAFIIFTDIVTVLAPFMTVIAGVLLIRKIGLNNLQGKAVLFLTLGFLSWGLADTYWIFSQETVSLADIFYFAGYLFLIIGVFQGIRISDPGMLKNPKRLLLFFLILVVLIGAYLYLYPLSWNYGIGVLENIATAGYVIVDLLLLIAVLFLIFSLLSGALSAGWIFIGLGVMVTLAGDLIYLSDYETYVNGDFIDLLWFLGYFFFTYAIVHFRRANIRAHELMRQQFESSASGPKTKK